MNFHEFREKLEKNFGMLHTLYGIGFQTDADKEKLWETYIESFPAKINPVYRKRREFDCSACRHFIKSIGGIVFIDADLNLHTIWGFGVDNPNYKVVLDAMDSYVRSCTVTDVFLSKEKKIGIEMSYEYKEDGLGKRWEQGKRWEHFHVELPKDMVFSSRWVTIDSERGKRRVTAQVFKRSLSEISMDAIDTVIDLINSNTLYRGSEWKTAMEVLRQHKSRYDALPEEKKNLYAWKNATVVGEVVGRIRNHSIGVLLTDISDGMDLNDAVTRYEKIVAPANYKRPKAIFTARMLEDAKKKVVELGYMDSLQRRYARLDDIRVNNILFSNKDAAKRIQGSVFDEMMSDAKSSPKKFDRVEEIPIEKFIKDVLPGAREIEAYVENRHAGNMVSLIAPMVSDAPSMFKWGNAFSWAYAGNIADSSIRENVKRAGGDVDGVLRFSIQWNDTDEYSRNDLDAHCQEPGNWGDHIFFGHKRSGKTGGQLDVDIINPLEGVPAVENITWASKDRMTVGQYKFFVHQYSNRGGRDGFRAEIAFDGKTYNYDYPKELRQGQNVDVAAVTFSKDRQFSITEHLKSTMASKEMWGIKTMSFVPVTVVMYSPNYWDEQNGNGNKHYMFMLKDCVNPERPNGFYNEFLKNELLEHKRVFEALGGKMSVEYVDDQLSGLGFSSTLRNELVVKVHGATERIMKIKF